MTSLNPVFSRGDTGSEGGLLHQGLSHAEAEAEALRMLWNFVLSLKPSRSSSGIRTSFRGDAPARHDRDGLVPSLPCLSPTNRRQRST